MRSKRRCRSATPSDRRAVSAAGVTPVPGQHDRQRPQPREGDTAHVRRPAAPPARCDARIAGRWSRNGTLTVIAALRVPAGSRPTRIAPTLISGSASPPAPSEGSVFPTAGLRQAAHPAPASARLGLGDNGDHPEQLRHEQQGHRADEHPHRLDRIDHRPRGNSDLPASGK